MSRGKAPLIETLLQTIPRKSSLLLCVSGGIDSCVLLHSVSQVARRLDLKLEIAHVNHKLREGSDEDAKFVEALAEKAGLSFHLKSAPSKTPKRNIEAWGRDLRYTFFESVRVKEKLSYVVTAHSASDNAETFLMRIIANRDPRTIVARDEVRKLLRPLLTVTRKEIEEYAKENNISYREDPSNSDLRFLRNRIRRSTIPYLAKEFDPRIVEVLSARARLVSEDMRALDSMADLALGKIRETTFGTRAWMKGVRIALEGAPPALQWRMVESLLLPKLGFKLGGARSLDVVGWILGDKLSIQLPGGVSLRRKEGGISILTTLSGGRDIVRGVED